MNRLSYQLAHNGHLTFRQKCRSLVFQIFGHEMPVKSDDLAVTSHCPAINQDIYRFNNLKLNMLATRKLLNPFKWLEFIVVSPLEMLTWWFQRAPHGITNHWVDSLEKWKNKLVTQSKTSPTFTNNTKAFFANLIYAVLNIVEKINWKLSDYILFPITHLATNLVTGVVRRIVAPARYIIRPSIDLAFDNPKTTLGLVALTIGLAGGLAATLLTGVLPIALGAAILGLVIWPTLLKLATVAKEFSHGLSQMKEGKQLIKDRVNHQPVVQFQQGSTKKISGMLHAIDINQVEVKPLHQQDSAYSFALFMGHL